MELRDFFTEDEVREMKEKVITRASLAYFMDEDQREDEDGKGHYHLLNHQIRAAIEDTAREELRDYVKDIINTTVKAQVGAAAENFTKRLCEQLEKITEKTNWYWSIK